jgi:hypothetical protein
MPPPQRLDVRTLSLESQRAHELLDTLRDHQEREARFAIMARAGATDPITVGGLHAVAEMFARLGMPLDQHGVTRFKADRGLVGGTAIGATVALAYARALEGDEVLIRVEKHEESALSPNEKATLAYLRTFQKKRRAQHLRPLKEALQLSNPPVSQDAWSLGNEYVGVHTVKEIAKASAMHSVTLSGDVIQTLVNKIKAASNAPPKKGRA